VKKSPLNVFVGQARVGAIARSDVHVDTYLFGYRTGCSAENAVSLTMPIRVDPYDAMAGLLPIFEMNLPEGALKERLRAQFAKAIPEFDDLDLLQIVGAAQIGRLRYSPREDLDLRYRLDIAVHAQGLVGAHAGRIEAIPGSRATAGLHPQDHRQK